MIVNRENIEVIKKMQLELDEAMGEATEKIALAKANVNNVVKWVKNGKEIECEEKHLWDETYMVGEGCDAYKTLANKYPEAFEAVKKQQSKVLEMNNYTVKNLGLRFNQVSIAEIIVLIEAVMDLKNAELANK